MAKQIVKTDRAPGSSAAYSQAVKAAGLVFGGKAADFDAGPEGLDRRHSRRVTAATGDDQQACVNSTPSQQWR